MKENVFDVLIYLFEKFMDGAIGDRPDADAVRTDLMEAGFPPLEITKALDWLDSLADMPDLGQLTPPAFRVFSFSEEARLDADARGLLMFLEQTGILAPESREQVIDRVMALDEDYLTLDNLKWIVLMVLFSRPDEELAFARMEHLVYGNFPATLH
jgi:Smg protein